MRIKWLDECDDQKRRKHCLQYQDGKAEHKVEAILVQSSTYTEIHHNLPPQLLLPSTFSESSLACYSEGGAAQSTLSGNDYSLP